jgi:hypothetical protein
MFIDQYIVAMDNAGDKWEYVPVAFAAVRSLSSTE